MMQLYGGNVSRDVPRLKKSNRNLTASYTLLLTPEMKERLVELKTFHEVDVPQLIRNFLTKKIKEIM